MTKTELARIAVLTTIALAVGCGSHSDKLSFDLSPMSATVQPNSETSITATNLSTSQEVEFDWIITEAAAKGVNCTQNFEGTNTPPLPPQCTDFGAIEIPFSKVDFQVTYVAPNLPGTFHIQATAHETSNSPGSPTGQQMAAITVR